MNYYSFKNIYKVLLTFSLTYLLSIGSIIGEQSIGTYILIPILFLITLVKIREKLILEIRLYGLLLLSAIISTTQSVDIDLSQIILLKLVGCLLIGIVITTLNNRYNIFSLVLYVYIISTIILILYEVFNGSLVLTNFLDSRNRDIYLLNANYYSYLIFYSTIGLYFIYREKKSTLLLLSIIIIQILFIITVFSTASRSGLLIILLINIGYWFFINNTKNLFVKAFKISLVLASFSYIYFSYYSGSFIAERSDRNSGIYDNSRESLLIDGVSVFVENPFLGVGPGNFQYYSKTGDYSHFSFIEVAATQGIFGLIFLILIYFIPIKIVIEKLINRIPNTDKTKYKMFLLFLLIFIFYNSFYPFYLYLDLMIFFFIVVSEIRRDIHSFS